MARRGGAWIILAALLTGCGLPETGGSSEKTGVPGVSTAASATPVPSATLDVPAIIQAAEATFPRKTGTSTYLDCSTAVTLYYCPLTTRLHDRLQSANITLCNCREPSPDRDISAELIKGQGVAHVQLFGHLLKIDLLVVPDGARLLVDDERLTGGGPETSIYATGPIERPTPKPSQEPAPKPVPSSNPNSDISTIPVPVIAQIMNLDCETGALQMALATSGHNYSQATLFALQRSDLRAAVMKDDGRVSHWGNPYRGFVGDVNGLQRNWTGYGVYWPVILEIARSHGRPGATGGAGLTAKAIYQAIDGGHPVEVWVETSFIDSWTDSWTSWDGATILYSPHEHAVTLSGVSPDSVRVNDPLHGMQYWISKRLFEGSWRKLANQAVIF
jgi:uncharacterized protein YvpB